LGDVASGVGIEKMPQLILAFGQIQAKGRLMGSELRQLTEAGFNLADAMGISSAKLEDMTSKGLVKFSDVKKAFESVTGEGGRFNAMMQQQSETTLGKITNLSDSMFKLKATIGEALLGPMNNLLAVISPLIDKLALFAKENPNITTGLIAMGLAIGALSSALLILLPILATINMVAGIAGISFMAMSGVVLAVVAVLALLAVAGYYVITNWEMIQTKATEIWTGVVTTITGIWDTFYSWMVGFFTNLQTFFTNIWTAITQDTMVQFWVSAINLVIGAVTLMVTLIQFNLQLLWSIVQIAFMLVYTIVSTIFNSMVEFAKTKLEAFKNAWLTQFNAVKNVVISVMSWLQTFMSEKLGITTEDINNALEKMKNFFKSSFEIMKSIVSSFAEGVTSFFNGIKSAIDGVIGKIREMIDAVKGLPSQVGGMIGFGGSHQHGGTIPGSFNQAVPAVLHGGERVVPRTGVDVNPSQGGGGGSTINLTIEGDVNSMDMVSRIVESVKSAIGRDNDLARYGVGI